MRLQCSDLKHERYVDPVGEPRIMSRCDTVANQRQALVERWRDERGFGCRSAGRWSNGRAREARAARPIEASV